MSFIRINRDNFGPCTKVYVKLILSLVAWLVAYLHPPRFRHHFAKNSSHLLRSIAHEPSYLNWTRRAA